MKRTFCTFLFFLTVACVYSQQKTEETLDIKDGTRLSYLFDLNKQKRVIDLIMKMPSDSLIIEWTLRSENGRYVILPEALESAEGMSFKRGEHQKTIVLNPDETFCMISQSAFKDLLKNNRFVYNNTTYVQQKEDDIYVDGSPVRTLHVKAEIDETEMWIIKNPRYPMIGKMIRNPLDINFTLISINTD